MPNYRKTEIICLLDRSGSMSSIKDDMEGGFNEFIRKQRKETVDDCVVSLYQFDDDYDVVYEGKALGYVPNLRLEPRNCTALLDAIGKTINNAGHRFNVMREDNRPGKIIFVVITDGLENASKEFTRAKIMDMIKHQRENYNWQFVFIGANQDSIQTGNAYGMFGASNKINFAMNSTGVTNMYNSLHDATLCSRSMNGANYVASCQEGTFFQKMM